MPDPDKLKNIVLRRPRPLDPLIFKELEEMVRDLEDLRFSARIEIASDRSVSAPWTTQTIGLEPGEPIRVKWEYYAGAAAQPNAIVSARIEFDGHVLYTASVPLIEKTTGVQEVDVVIANPEVARAFYTFGLKTLTLSIEGARSPGAKRKTHWNVLSPVLGAPFTGYWFTWEQPAEQVAFWKEAFTVGGTFVNRMRYTTIASVHLRLFEDGPSAEDVIAAESGVEGLVAPGVKVEQRFAIRAKEFHWIDGPPNWDFLEDKWIVPYHYTVNIAMRDIYGNTYQEIPSRGPVVHVVVSDSKVRYALQAEALSSVASALAIAAALGAGWVSGLAANLAYQAGRAGAKALDPPELDPQFKVDVKPTVPTFPSVGHGLEPLEELLGHIAFIVSHDMALTEIEGKLLGAQAAQDAHWIRAHTEHYEQVRQEALNRFVALESSLPAALASLQHLRTPKQDAQQRLRLPAESRQQALREGLGKAGLDTATFGHVMSYELQVQEALLMTDEADRIRSVVQGMATVVKAIASYTPAGN
jgi:hypothetical protein